MCHKRSSLGSRNRSSMTTSTPMNFRERWRSNAMNNGDAVRMRLSGNSEWSFGRVVGEGGPRSHWVEVNGKPYRRNRKFVRSTPEKLEPTATSYDFTRSSERGESSSADVSLPTMLVSSEVPDPCPKVVQCVSVALQCG